MKNLLKTLLPALALAATSHAHADWALLGDAFSANSTQVRVSTAFNEGEDAPFNITGNPAVWIDTLEAAAGVPFHTLDLLDEPAYEGSLASQSFNVQAGDVLTFHYTFTTQETLFQDHAFLLIDGGLHLLGTRSSHPPTGAWFNYTFQNSGAVTLAFGVVDTGDFNGVTQLGISEFTLTPVPEPASWALWLAGAAGLAALRRRQR